MQPRGNSLGCGKIPSGSALAARIASASLGMFLILVSRTRSRRRSGRPPRGGAYRFGLVGNVLDHGVQDQVSAGQRAVRVDVRIERTGRLDESGQQGGLLPVQVRGVDTEIRLRRVLHAESVVADRAQVEVAGQDLRLGEGLV